MSSRTLQFAANSWEFLKDLAGGIAERAVLITYFWLLVATWTISAAYRQNVMSLVGLAAGVAFILAHLWLYENFVAPEIRYVNLWRANRDLDERRLRSLWASRERNREGWLDTFHLTRGELLYFIVLLGIVPLIFSMMITTKLHLSDKSQYAAVGGKVASANRWFVLSHPFAPVIWIKSDQISRVSMFTATTIDNVPVTIQVKSDLRLPSNDKLILAYVEEGAETVMGVFEQRFEAAFNRAVQCRRSETLGGPYLAYLIQQESQDILRNLPLAQRGEFVITPSFKIGRSDAP